MAKKPDPTPREIHYVLDSNAIELPADARAAVARLNEGNRQFVGLIAGRVASPLVRHDDLGNTASGDAPEQAPFACVLGCSDARVPAEFLFNEGFNDLFSVRVAGNVLPAEAQGSLEYAVQTYSSVKLLVVLGHTGCGAVHVAVDLFRHPEAYLTGARTRGLRALVDRILPAVGIADRALKAAFPAAADHKRYPDALLLAAVPVNAALVAATVVQEFAGGLPDQQVVFGVYDLKTQQVGLLPVRGAGREFSSGLEPAVASGAVDNLADRVVSSPVFARMLRA